MNPRFMAPRGLRSVARPSHEPPAVTREDALAAETVVSLAPPTPASPPPAADDDYEIRVVGAPRTPLRDFYHALLRLEWPATMGFIAAGFILVNALFALLFFVVGGVEHARPGVFLDDFYFSVQTMGTIGYGYMYPASPGANFLVVLESASSLVVTALATGLVFAKFSRPSARLVFSERIAVSPMNGVPTLSFRIGNQRKNRIVEAGIHVVVMRSERTLEGKAFYRATDLKLARDRLSLARSWNVMHFIDETSPLFRDSPESLVKDEVEILVSVTGLDDTWMQTVHAQYRYTAKHILFGYRLVDVLHDNGSSLTLDLTKFHEVEPAEPTPTFPYPR